MQVIQTTVYRVLGKDYLTEKEALEAENNYINKHCNFKKGEEIFFLDKIECKVSKSIITNITINEYDSNVYVNVKGYDGALKPTDIYKELNQLMYDIRQNLTDLTK